MTPTLPQTIFLLLWVAIINIYQRHCKIRSDSWSYPITVNIALKILPFSWVKLKRFCFDKVLFLLYFGCEHVKRDSISLTNKNANARTSHCMQKGGWGLAKIN